MDLYFSPLACSMATRIVFYEAGASPRFVRVNTKAGRVEDGSDFKALNPLGQVPLLRTDDGQLVSENAAILQSAAHQPRAAGRAPPAGTFARTRLQEWLSFISSELHKTLSVLLRRDNPEGAKEFARGKLDARLGLLEAHFRGHE